MKYEPDKLYHIFNQSNARKPIFKAASDYETFLGKVERWITPNCHVIAYCLMPNHFHLLVKANQKSVGERKLGMIVTNELSNGLRIAQSQYAQYYNEVYKSSGSIFRPKPKFKCLNNGSGNYILNCFLYILQNPVKAKLCSSPFAWNYSSANEMKKDDSKIIDLEETRKTIDINWEDLDQELESLTHQYRQKIADHRQYWL